MPSQMDVAPCWMGLDLSFWLTEYYPSRFEYLIWLGVGDDIASEKQTHDWRKGEKEQSQSWRCAHLMSCGKKIWIFSFACYNDKNQLLVVICTCWFVLNSIFLYFFNLAQTWGCFEWEAICRSLKLDKDSKNSLLSCPPNIQVPTIALKPWNPVIGSFHFPMKQAALLFYRHRSTFLRNTLLHC